MKSYIRAIPDFPIPGILFRDITPLLKDKQAFKAAIDLFVDRFKDRSIDYVVGIEARGYMLGSPLAYAIGAGFVHGTIFCSASSTTVPLMGRVGIDGIAAAELSTGVAGDCGTKLAISSAVGFRVARLAPLVTSIASAGGTPALLTGAADATFSSTMSRLAPR